MYKSARARTRDRLLQYDINIVPPHPHTGSITVPYPNENMDLNYLSSMLYLLAKKSGYNGTNQDFYRYFGLYLEQNKQEIIFARQDEFPDIGQMNQLYFNVLDNTLYCWNGTEYQPINAMLIANTIIEGGGA